MSDDGWSIRRHRTPTFPNETSLESPSMEPRPTSDPSNTARHYVGLIVIVAATAQSLGVALRMPTQLTANDISRYCTVWSLLERGTYAIDDCPWQKDTQDKIRKADPFSKETPAPEHYYSSKPPLFSTLIAGVLYPFRVATGVPLDSTFEQKRLERNVQKEVPGEPGRTQFVKETPPPVIWQAYILYLKPAILLVNVVPFAFFLALYVKLLDRYAPDDWAWFVSLFAAAWGNSLVVFNSSLNNHTIAAYSAFFAIYALIRILEEEAPKASTFAMAGFWGAFCTCNEVPAALFGVLLFLLIAVKDVRRTFLYFVPAAILPLVAFFGTQYLAMGTFRLAYEEFGTKAYNYEGSYWNTPLEFDWFNLHPEPKGVYLFHMTFGHHGIFSLTPIFLFSIYACLRNIIGSGRPLKAVSWVTLVLTIFMLAFYTVNPKASNYGGSTSGLRWLFWLIPLWLVVLPTGLEAGPEKKWARRLSLTALGFSVLSVGYSIRSPWSHPWILDLMEHLNLYTMVR
ncbi:hypothetical protein P12x_000870 [Tundrisphaera lichenicola]|uniref:hypothetical protein n=1 Tax=Tundrisphaera lichenicola TaxID=2029860 RepID=UPI003EBFC925